MYIFSVSYKLLQSPQWPKGLLPATHSSLCSPHALQVSGETLVQRFCVPTTLNSKVYSQQLTPMLQDSVY